MTTIAYKDGVLAADTRMIVSDHIISSCTKIRYLPNGVVVACAGNANNEAVALKYFSGEKWMDEEPPDIKKGFECILITKTGVPMACHGSLRPFVIEHPYYAVGTGTEFALAAMEMGKGAVEAVKFSARLDCNTNDSVTVYEIKNHAKKKVVPKPQTV